MKTRLLMFIVMVILPFVIPQGFTLCAVNDDWPSAPCLDTISNGCKNAEGVGKWSEYYFLKGSSLMETKKSEMVKSFEEDNLDDWISESSENSNVWRYYYLKGEIPNDEGKYYDTIKCSAALHIPGNPIWPIPYSSWIILGISIGVPSVIIVRFWRKRK